MAEQKKIVTFLDSAQRTIIGTLKADREHEVEIENPVVVNIVPQINEQTGRPSGQMALQLLPVFFKEFQGVKSSPAVFKYNKQNITFIDFEGGFDFRLYGQYEHIFNPSTVSQDNTPPPVNNAPEAAPVIKLFED